MSSRGKEGPPLQPSQRLVLGTWGIAGLPANSGAAGPAGYGEVSQDKALEVLDAAWDAGIRLVDTAPAYGDRQGYYRLVHWHASRGRQFGVVVKPGRPRVRGVPTSRLELDSLLAEVREAARLLGPPVAILIKDPPETWARSPALGTALQALAARWPTSRVGLATHVPALCEVLPAIPGTTEPPIMQVEYNAANRASAVPAALAARGRGWDVWGMQPLAYGFLACRDPLSRQFPPSDWRSSMPGSARTTLALASMLFTRALPPLAAARPPAEPAIAWCLADPSVQRVVIGPKSAVQLQSALRALRLVQDSTFAEFCCRERARLVTAVSCQLSSPSTEPAW